jgi:hypothetical protein
MKRQIEVKSKHREHSAHTEASLQKAQTSYTNQNELLELRVADCRGKKQEDYERIR